MKTLSIEKATPLAPLTTFGIGGPAEYFKEVKREEEIEELVELAREEDLPIFVMGEGSNILVSDQGFPGLVIRNQIKGIKEKKEGERVFLKAGSGENWDKLTEYAVRKNLAGIECLSGIPGTVGAAPVQNIAAYGEQIGDVITEVKALDLKSGEARIFTNADCGFEYRKSIFNTKDAGRYLITQVTLELERGGEPVLNYHDLKNYFTGNSKPTLAEVRQAVIEIRANKGMVIRPEYESFRSAGSFFKNPVIDQETFRELGDLISRRREPCRNPWYWPIEEDRVKVSAACLMEQAGFTKGLRRGKVGISPRHPLALINCGGAGASEMISLAREIQRGVLEQFGVRLEPEVQLIGFEQNPLAF